MARSVTQRKHFRGGYPAHYFLRFLRKGYLVYRKSLPADYQYWCTSKKTDTRWTGGEFICVISDEAWKFLTTNRYITADTREGNLVYYTITSDGDEYLDSLLDGRQRTRTEKPIRIRTRQ